MTPSSVLFYTLRRLHAEDHADFLVLVSQGKNEPRIGEGSRAAIRALGCIVKVCKEKQRVLPLFLAHLRVGC